MERPARAKVDSYEEMMRRYETFNVYVPEVGPTLFKGAENEHANYARLMHMSGAEITNYVTRIDLVRAIADLTAGHYSRRANATDAGNVLAWVPIAIYSGELDGERVQFHLLDNRSAWVQCIDRRTRFNTIVEMSILQLHDGGLDDVVAAVHRAVGPMRYASFAQDLSELRDALANGDKRVVFVTHIKVRSLEWSELPLRITHAALAILAQLGFISGRSPVVFDKKMYGWGDQIQDRALEEGLRGSRYAYKMRRIGRNLLFVAADEMTNPLAGVSAYKAKRAAEIGTDIYTVTSRSSRSSNRARRQALAQDNAGPSTNRES
jgi:hypothetical protein